jgi:2,3-bisphosphoglycerate-independent phosphoglycerate mutase
MEAARTPNMDRVSAEGELGLCQTIPRGMAPGSDVAIMSLLGYNPREHYTGRAPLEAASMDVALGDGDWAVRCNLVTVSGKVLEDYCAGHISTREARVLVERLDEELGGEGVRFYPGVGYRHLLVLRDPGPMDVTTVPPHDVQGHRMARHLPRGEGSELLLELMRRSTEILEGHELNRVRVDLGQNPANMIWLWGEGRRPSFTPFRERYGVEGVAISAVDLVKGLAKLLGLEVVDVPGATGYLDTDYAAKARYAIDALERTDLAVIHVEAPDEMGHEGNIANKVRAIEHVDREIVGPVLSESERLGDLRVLVMPDHYTPIEKRTHTREAVPFAIWGAGVAAGSGLSFSEANAAQTGLRLKAGHEIMARLIGRGPSA